MESPKTEPISPTPISLRSLERNPVWAVLLLAFITLVVYLPICSYEFVDYDDDLYVTKNPQVEKGLTIDGIISVFTQSNANFYHPLTIVSHMIDVELFGLNPVGHHATNLVFHVINTVLLFLVLRRMTGEFWPAIVITAIFQLHPLRVESVAWVAERKDLLSMFFALLTFYWYLRHAQGATETSNHQKGRRTLFLSLIFFVCGLLSKPMLVTLPFMLLLLDFWPLRRIEIVNWSSARRGLGELIREKKWFFVLIIPVIFATVSTQSSSGAIKSTEAFSLSLRLQNAPVAVLKYLEKTFWPTKLAALYPYPSSFSFLTVASAILVIAGITVVVLWWARRFPFLPVGWFWFLGGLVPVIGLVQAGEQSMADRFVYLPTIGLLVAIVLLLCAVLPRWIFAVFSMIAIVACVSVTRHQLPYWETKFTLFKRAASVTENNYVAQYHLGDLLFFSGNADAALAHYREAIRINPLPPEARNSYAMALAETGKTNEALQLFLELIRDHPKSAMAYANLGTLHVMLGKPEEAELNLKKAVELDPNDSDAQINLGNIFFRRGKTNEALGYYNTAIRLKPTDAKPHYWSARLLLGTDPQKAIEHFQRAVQLQPDWVAPMNEIAWLLATHPENKIRNGALALQFAAQACELTQFRDAKAIASLEVAYAEQGRFTDAIDVATKEIEMARQSGHPEKVDSIQERIALYRSGKPFRQP